MQCCNSTTVPSVGDNSATYSGRSLAYGEKTVPGTATLQNEAKCGLMLDSSLVMLYNLLEFRDG